VQQTVTRIVSIIFVNLATPKACAQHEHLFNKPAAGCHTCDHILLLHSRSFVVWTWEKKHFLHASFFN